MKLFDFNYNSKLILYGAATIGNIFHKKLSDAGFNIIGFIDKRAYELATFCEKPVWNLDEISDDIINDEQTICIITVKNVYEHEEIKADLISVGFKSIIFKPKNILLNDAKEIDLKIDNAYENLYQDTIKEIDKIPCSQDGIKYNYKDYGLIKNINHKYLIANIPIEMIFTNNYTERNNIWCDINIAAFFTHIYFFNAVSGKDSNLKYENYIEDYCVPAALDQNVVTITESWKKNVIHNRAMIYREMKLSLEIDKDFFIRNSAEAIWNSNGYFNLTGGKHRVMFLFTEGYRYIPLKINQEDYNNFLNLSVAMQVFQKMKNKKLNSLTADIPHPYFYRYSASARDFYFGLVKSLVLYYAKEIYLKNGKVDFSNISILDALNDDGASSRYLKKVGFDVSRLEHKSENLQVLLDQLMYVQDIHVIKGEEKSKVFDLILISNYNFKECHTILSNVKYKNIVLMRNSEEKLEDKGFEYNLIFSGYCNNDFYEVILYKSKMI